VFGGTDGRALVSTRIPSSITILSLPTPLTPILTPKVICHPQQADTMAQDADGLSYSPDDDEKIIKIRLNNDGLDQSVLAARRATTRFQAAPMHNHHKFAVAASMVYPPADGGAQRLRIITRSERDILGTKDATPERWL